MAKLTLSDVSNLLGNPTSAQNTINNNSTLIEQALENTLSRDGTTPNQMGADLDMNNYDILNIGTLDTKKLILDGEEFKGLDPEDLEIIKDVSDAIQDGTLSNVVSQGNVPIYATVIGMPSVSVPSAINAIRVNGYYSDGDGLGNIYVKDAGENGFRETVTDANGEIFYEAGDILRPVTISIPGDFANLNELFDYLNLRRIRAKVTVNVTAGVIDHPGLLVISHPDAKNVEVFGDFSSHTISSVGVASGAAYAWDVPFTLDDVTGVDVGQFVQIEAKATNGAGDGSNIEGTWRIVSVAGNIVTVRITSRTAAFPGVTDVNIGCRILKSVLRWDSAVSSGIYIAGTAAGYFGNIVLDGQYDVATGIGSDTAGNGLFVGGFSHIVMGLSGDQMPATASVTFRRCAFVRWKADGVLVHGNAQAELAFSHGCSNGWRGIQSGGGGSSIFAKSCVGSGNRKSGIECEAAGSLNINNSVAAGNGEAGIYSPFNGSITGTNCRSLLNVGSGVDLRRQSSADMTGTISKNNTTNGFYADRNSVCCVDGVSCSGNPDGDLRAQYNGRMSATVAPTLSSATPYRTITTSPGFFDIPGISGQVTNGIFLNSPSGANGGGVIAPISSGALSFQLRSTANGSATSTYEMTTAALRPVFDNTVSLGDGSHRFTSIFAASGTINTSDERSKSDIGAIPDAWLDAWGEVEWCRFKFRDAIDTKGDGARWHIGLIAQQVRDVFAERGIDAFEIGLLCYDKWEASDGEVDDDGHLIRPAIEAGNRFGIRYDEAQAIEAAYQRRRLARVETLLEVNQASDLS